MSHLDLKEVARKLCNNNNNVYLGNIPNWEKIFLPLDDKMAVMLVNNDVRNLKFILPHYKNVFNKDVIGNLVEDDSDILLKYIPKTKKNVFLMLSYRWIDRWTMKDILPYLKDEWIDKKIINIIARNFNIIEFFEFLEEHKEGIPDIYNNLSDYLTMDCKEGLFTDVNRITRKEKIAKIDGYLDRVFKDENEFKTLIKEYFDKHLDWAIYQTVYNNLNKHSKYFKYICEAVSKSKLAGCAVFYDLTEREYKRFGLTNKDLYDGIKYIKNIKKQKKSHDTITDIKLIEVKGEEKYLKRIIKKLIDHYIFYNKDETLLQFILKNYNIIEKYLKADDLLLLKLRLGI